MFESFPGWASLWSDEDDQNEGISEQFLVMCGVLMGALSSFINCVGMNLQKQSLCDPLNEDVLPHKQPKWLAGLWCIIIGSSIDFLAFGLAPQSLLAPLAALSLVWNLGMASYMLGEKYTRKDLYATTTIFIGTGMSVSNAPHEEMEYGLEDLKELWGMNRMFYYCIVIPILLGFHYLLVFFSENPSHFLTPSFFKINENKGISSLTSWRHKAVGFIRMSGYCGFAGIIGGQSLLFAKSIVELVKTAFKGSGVFWHIEPYVIVLMLALCLLLQIHYLNSALKYFDSLYVVPVYQSYWILAGVSGGLVYFGEWDKMSASASRLFVIGILVTFLGLYILTQKEHHASANSASFKSHAHTNFEKDRKSDFGDSFDTNSHNRKHKNGKVYDEIPQSGEDSENYDV